MKALRNKYFRRFLGVLAGLLLLFLLRWTILGAVGNYLIVQDAKERVDAVYVLSGNSFDRGREAAALYNEGWSQRIVCLGGETNPALELYGIEDKTSQMTAGVLLEEGVPESHIELLPEGTSTFEEFEAIGGHAKRNGFRKVMVVSSLFHTRRIHAFFRLRLHFKGIGMVLRGASESGFEENRWWTFE